ncbi:Gfo/Idh/MocA family protein [Paludifilum halophilum]|uniref:Quinolinate phosphoribosyl transferase n=1 Tax=Paludifilum halophilum TaxID=1642702 RepID=A0A235B4C8_9BACL|nr:Gfo/Idh/MocA family oxidoreductase [Paludifilum halophilum]OYD07160.1 quinolinate phosphoribosyl transferase [Paludifilum halophilum]
MNKHVSTVLVGIGGYGRLYLKELFDRSLQHTIKGVVDIHPTLSEYYDRIVQNNIPVFSSLEAFYEQWDADLAVISTPIHFHAQQTCYALSHGSHVLCEKPMSTTVEGARQIMETRDRTGKFVAIGFNWSFTPSIQRLKADVLSGRFGKAKRFKTIVLWPRNEDYYKRASWAGRKYSANGDIILDSVANNATSHFLHHMFYLLGPEKERSVEIEQLTAELYRANEIENFDTCAVRVQTKEGTELLFFASHAAEEEAGPRFVFEFEKAVITYHSHQGKGHMIAHFHDGTKKVYQDPEEDHLAKLRTCLQAAEAGNRDILCGPEAAMTHVQCISGMHQSVPEVVSFPKTFVKRNPDTKFRWVEGLSDALMACFHKWRLPGEAGVPWGKKGRTVHF